MDLDRRIELLQALRARLGAILADVVRVEVKVRAEIGERDALGVVQRDTLHLRQNHVLGNLGAEAVDARDLRMHARARARIHNTNTGRRSQRESALARARANKRIAHAPTLWSFAFCPWRGVRRRPAGASADPRRSCSTR